MAERYVDKDFEEVHQLIHIQSNTQFNIVLSIFIENCSQISTHCFFGDIFSFTLLNDYLVDFWGYSNQFVTNDLVSEIVNLLVSLYQPCENGVPIRFVQEPLEMV